MKNTKTCELEVKNWAQTALSLYPYCSRDPREELITKLDDQRLTRGQNIDNWLSKATQLMLVQRSQNFAETVATHPELVGSLKSSL